LTDRQTSRLVGLILTAVIASALATAVVKAQGGVEYNVVAVWVPKDYSGQLGILIAPLNASDPSLVTYLNAYVLDETGQPRYSYVFSTYPPLILWVEGATSTRYYSVFYGGANPYASMITTQMFAAFDDFDYVSGLWTMVNSEVSGGKLAVRGGGHAVLNTSYGGDAAHAFLILGRRAFAITFNVSDGWVVGNLTSREFTDWQSVADGSDIYFLNPDGTPLNYSIIYLSKEQKTLTFAVRLTGSPTVFMLYGGANPYAGYRVG